ncbi:hypothetical protein ABEB36_011145 [Hypothenemus hampei]|uniref:Uncharacterized protein n=1 Tax=Hypothenemus hampei TaxID=57062 RepID=A0ABD1EEC7_HYPHA
MSFLIRPSSSDEIVEPYEVQLITVRCLNFDEVRENRLNIDMFQWQVRCWAVPTSMVQLAIDYFSACGEETFTLIVTPTMYTLCHGAPSHLINQGSNAPNGPSPRYRQRFFVIAFKTVVHEGATGTVERRRCVSPNSLKVKLDLIIKISSR